MIVRFLLAIVLAVALVPARAGAQADPTLEDLVTQALSQIVAHRTRRWARSPGEHVDATRIRVEPDELAHAHDDLGERPTLPGDPGFRAGGDSQSLNEVRHGERRIKSAEADRRE